MPKTKIVATISDRNADESFIRSLYEEGMNVVRMNTAHQTPDQTLKVVESTRKVSDKIALLLDTKGPEVRTTYSPEEVKVERGDQINVEGDPSGSSTRECIYVTYEQFAADVPVGSNILFDDGEVELTVKGKDDNQLVCEVNNTGVIKARKSVNVPNVPLNMTSISKKDYNYILFAIEQDLDFIAHSFVRSKEDVLAIQEILDEHNSDVKIIAKIENQQGVENA
ncbi:MAG TPA: pyruvate kinase, partial [Bacteroidales bacterium]|nr:pyruvate kinase [Bacteroidales bacterium]